MDDRPCTRCGSTDARLDSLPLDGIDHGFLAAARTFFCAFAGNDPSAWVSAVLASDHFFAGPNSAETMRRALGVVQEMRCARVSCFRFSNPRCPSCRAVVTQDERFLLEVVQSARQGKMSRAKATAMLLCEGNETSQLIAAAQDFAEAVQADRQPVWV